MPSLCKPLYDMLRETELEVAEKRKELGQEALAEEEEAEEDADLAAVAEEGVFKTSTVTGWVQSISFIRPQFTSSVVRRVG